MLGINVIFFITIYSTLVADVIMLGTIMVVSILGVCTSDVSASRKEQNPFRYFSTRTAYNVVRNKRNSDENIPGTAYQVINHAMILNG